MDKLNIEVVGSQGELIIREGKAPDIKPPINIEYSGNIHAPWNYLVMKMEQYRPERSTLFVDRKKGKIHLVLNELDPVNIQNVTGVIARGSIFETFSINKEKKFASGELAKFLKMHSFYFKDQEEARKIIIALNRFSAVITTVIDDTKDNRGNTKKSLEKTVSNEVPTDFVLKAAIVDGEGDIEIPVEICAEADSTGVSFFLESPQAESLYLDYVETLIEDEVSNFHNWGCSVINQ
jgi:hypothetical protein